MVHYEQTVRLSWNGVSAVRPWSTDDEPTEMGQQQKGRRKSRLQRVSSRRGEAGAGNDERGAAAYDIHTAAWLMDMAGGVLRTCTRPTLNQIPVRASVRALNLIEGKSCWHVRSRFECLFSMALPHGPAGQGHPREGEPVPLQEHGGRPAPRLLHPADLLPLALVERGRFPRPRAPARLHRLRLRHGTGAVLPKP